MVSGQRGKMQIVNQVVKLSDQPGITEIQIMINQVFLKVAANTPNIEFGHHFSDRTPKAQVTKVKIGKLDYMKIKNVQASKYTINGVESEPTE